MMYDYAGEDDDRDKNIAIHEFEVLLEVFDLFNKAVNDASKLIDQVRPLFVVFSSQVDP